MSSLATSVEDFDRLKELTLQKILSKEISLDPNMREIVLRANLCDVLLTTDCCAGHFEKVRKQPDHHINIAFLVRGSEGAGVVERLFERLILVLHEAPYAHVKKMTGQLMMTTRYRYVDVDRSKRYLVKNLSINVRDQNEQECFLAILCGVVSQLPH